MLSGVDQLVGDPGLAKSGVYGRRFHEVRSGSDDGNNHDDKVSRLKESAASAF
jgi:hypothetical protein